MSCGARADRYVVAHGPWHDTMACHGTPAASGGAEAASGPCLYNCIAGSLWRFVMISEHNKPDGILCPVRGWGVCQRPRGGCRLPFAPRPSPLGL